MNKQTRFSATWLAWLSLLLTLVACARPTPDTVDASVPAVHGPVFGMMPQALGCNYVGNYGVECTRASDSQNIANNVATPIAFYGAPLVPLQQGWSARFDGTVHLRTQACDGGPWCDCDIHRIFPGTLWNGTFTRADGIASDILVDSYCGFAGSAQISVNAQGLPNLLATCSPACTARGKLVASITMAPFDGGFSDAGDAGLPFAPFQVNQIVETGQSLAEGHLATYQSPTTTRYSNLALNDSANTYNISNPSAGTLSLAAATGPYRPSMTTGAAYPNNQDGQVASFQMMDQLTLASGGSSGIVQIASNVGQDGSAYSVIGKGGTGNAYAAGVYEVTAAHNLTGPGSSYGGAGGKTHGVTALLLTHGEADAQVTSVTAYNQDIWTLLSNAQADYAAVTGQSFVFPEILSSQSSSPSIGNGIATTAKSEWQTSYRSLGQSIILAGPKYQYPYADGSPGLHITGPAQVQLGELYAEAWQTWRTTGSWQPVWPTSITASQASTSVTVAFNVPAGPLVFDGANSPPHQSGTAFSAWSAGKGLEFYDTILGGLVNGEPAQGLVTNVTNASPPVFTTSVNHPFVTSDVITIQNVVMATSGASQVVNGGPFTITKIDATHFSLNGVSAPGAAFSGAANSIVYKPITISSAAISGTNVNVTLSRTPGADATIGYAMTADEAVPGTSTGGFGTTSGNSYGRCGLIRDSSTYAGISGTVQPNWAVPFQIELFPPSPTITGIVPANGPTAGNTPVTIYGTGFTNSMAIGTAGVPLKSYYILSDGIAIGVTAPGTGSGPVTVSDLTGQSASLANAWTYVNGRPTVTALGPFAMIQGQAGLITGLGSGFTGATGVTVGGVAATNVTVVSDAKITFKTPTAGLSASGTPVNVVITTPAGPSPTGWATRFGVLPSSVTDFWQVTSPTYSLSAGVSTVTDFLGTDNAVSTNTTSATLVNNLSILAGQPSAAYSSSKLVTTSAAMTPPLTLGVIAAANGANATVGDILNGTSASFPVLGYTSNNLFANTGALLGNVTPPAALQGNGSCVIFIAGTSGQLIADGTVLASGSSGTSTGTSLQFGNGNQGSWSGNLPFVWDSTIAQSSGDQAIMRGFSQAFYGTP